MTRNQDLARIFTEMAQILEIQGVAFKPRAYERVAQNLESLGEDIEIVAREDRLGDIPGVGESIEKKIREFLETGKVRALETLRKGLPRGLVAIMGVPNVGPKTAKRLHDELGITSVKQLEKAARGGKIRTLKGFGVKSEQEILDGVLRHQATPGRTPYASAYEVARDYVDHLRATGLAKELEPAGSLRRGRQDVGDLDLLATSARKDAKRLIEAFTGHRDVVKGLESGATRARVVLRSGFQVDLRVVDSDAFGAALLYFTGSKEHNIALRTRALRKGWTINEYALAHKKSGRRIAGRTEEEIYRNLGLAWVPPELRENQGEIELAAKDKLPVLVELGDLRGDLHTHTTESDGTADAKAMIGAAQELGYAWYGISDHSKGLGIARGLDGKRYAAQRKALDKLRDDVPKLDILHGAEINIRKDGRLDLEPAVVRELDYAIGSIHSSFNLGAKEQTDRILSAFDQGIDILGHPTGRLAGDRPEIQADWETVFEAAADAGVLLEINASPFRLDMWGERIRAAAEHKAEFVIDTDAHTTGGLKAMHFGVTQARRGGLEKGQVANSLTAKQLRKRLGRARRA